MRVILFRAKQKGCCDWFIGDLSYHKDGRVFIRCWDFPGYDPKYNAYEIDPETVGQCTGLNDKNGQKIFEGDCIRAVLPASKAQREFAWPVMPVVYSRGAFGLEDSHGEVTPLRSFAPYVTFEVVGNIHDNSELVKEEPK